jgi:hypothetical protein
MGKCVICGNETKNLYIVHSADQVEVKQGFRNTTYTYDNFEIHQEYVCNECIVGKGKGSLIGMLVGMTVLFIVGIAMFFGGLSEEDYMTVLLGGLFSFGAIGIVFYSIRAKKASHTDDAIYDKDNPVHSGEHTLIYKYLSKEDRLKGRTFFTPEQFLQLNINIKK